MKLQKLIAFALTLCLLCIPFAVMADDEEEVINYAVYDSETWVEGENLCALDPDFDYTVYFFAPERIGNYLFESDSNICIAGANGMWVDKVLDEATVSEKSFSWTCTDLGQAILVAVEGGKATETVTITWSEYVVVTIPRTPYENKTTPTDFDFPYAESSLEKVDTTDDVENKAVLGEDGFYHLDSAEGPILYANLDDAAMSLSGANSYGQLVYPVYEGETLISKVDYTEAFTAYETAADDDTLLYPLTDDLIAIFRNMGESNGWYGEDGWVGGELGDAWMYACYWKPEYNGLGDVNADGEINQYDYILVKRHYFETRMLTDDEIGRADVNDDEVVDQFDYVLIMRHYFGTYVIG